MEKPSERELNPYDAPAKPDPASPALVRHDIKTLSHVSATLFFLGLMLAVVLWTRRSYPQIDPGWLTSLLYSWAAPLGNILLLVIIVVKELVVVQPTRRRWLNWTAILVSLILSLGLIFVILINPLLFS